MNYNTFLHSNRSKEETIIVNIFIDAREELLREYYKDPGVDKYEGFVWHNNKIIDTFIRLYYHTETKSFYYVARIGGKERRREYRCDLWSMEQVIEHFKKDIEKSKKFKEKQKIDKIKEDF